MADISCSADTLNEFFQQQADMAEVLNGEIDFEIGDDLESISTPAFDVFNNLKSNSSDPLLSQTSELATTVCDRRLAVQNPTEYLLRWCAETRISQKKSPFDETDPDAFNPTSYYIPLGLPKAQPKYLEESAVGNKDNSNHLKPLIEVLQLIKKALNKKLESSSLDHDYGLKPANSDQRTEEVPDSKNYLIKTAEYTSIADNVKKSRSKKQNLQNIPPIQEEVDVVTVTEPFQTLSVSRLHDPSASEPSHRLDASSSTSGLQRRGRKARSSSSTSQNAEHRNEIERRRRMRLKMKLESLKLNIPEIRAKKRISKHRVLTTAKKYIFDLELEVNKNEEIFKTSIRERRKLKNIFNALSENF